MDSPFDKDNDAAVQKQLEAILPDLRMFKVRAYLDGASRDIFVYGHTAGADECGSLSFVTMRIWQGRVLGQTTRIIRNWEDVEEIPMPKVGALAH
jgi:hypothetical protein